jgi:hypothetical protein
MPGRCANDIGSDGSARVRSLATGSRLVAVAGLLAFAHVGGFAAEQEVVAHRCEEVDHLRVFAESGLVFGTSRNDDNVAGAADALFAAQTEFHPALEHPTICGPCGSTWAPACRTPETELEAPIYSLLAPGRR